MNLNKNMIKIALISTIMLVGGLSGCIDIPDELIESMTIVTFFVEPAIIESGESANLSWVVTGVDTLVIIDNGIGNVSLTGNRIIMPAETTTYTLTATNSTATITATTQIIIRNETNEITPIIVFTQHDQSSINTLTVVSVDPIDLDWSDIELLVDGTVADHGMSGTVSAGDIIDITSIAGTGAYTISIKHIPTNTLIGLFEFTGVTVNPVIVFTQHDQSSINTLTVVSVDPIDLDWSDIELLVDGSSAEHGMSGTVSAGDIIDITSIAGTGEYTISIKHIPTNTLIGEFSFTIPPVPWIMFAKVDSESTNTLTVTYTNPNDIMWANIVLKVDGTAQDHGMSGTVTVGDMIDITSIAGTGAYTVTLRHTPTNVLFGTYDFTAAHTENTFPTELNQYLIYEISSTADRFFKVTDETTFLGHNVFKVIYEADEFEEYPTDSSSYLYVDEIGRIWKSASNYGFEIYNYDNHTHYNNRTDTYTELPENSIQSYELFIGSWWQQQDLTIGTTFSYQYGLDSNHIFEFEVLEIESITVPAGEFEAYKLNIQYNLGSPTNATYWIDTETNVLIKWMTNPDNGDDLKEMEL